MYDSFRSYVGWVAMTCAYSGAGPRWDEAGCGVANGLSYRQTVRSLRPSVTFVFALTELTLALKQKISIVVPIVHSAPSSVRGGTSREKLASVLA
jgi:hypothetical protein